jgi:hypothetical protein
LLPSACRYGANIKKLLLFPIANRTEFRVPILIRQKEEEELNRPFQFRSVQRDAFTDQERVGSVVKAIDTALASAMRERDVLSVRVRAARDLASFAVGMGDDEYLSREAKDQIRIEEYEQQMMVGEKRIRELNHQIANLEALQGRSRQIFPSSENRS